MFIIADLVSLSKVYQSSWLKVFMIIPEFRVLMLILNQADYKITRLSQDSQLAILQVLDLILFVLLLYIPSQQLWSLRDHQFT